MKNTQKLPLFLSTVMLTTGIGSSAVAATNYLSEQPPVNALSDTVIGEQTSEIAAIPENLYNTDFRLSVIWIDNNRITVVFDQANQMLKSVTLAYFDYENGATEAQADAKLATLGEESSEVWALLAERQYTEKAMMGLMSLSPDQHKVAENKTDMIYYAAEFAVEQPDGTATTKWVRGKVNYRRCIHAPQYTESRAGVCNESVEGDQVVFWLNNQGSVDMPADLEVITWEAEWRQIQEARLREAEAAVLAAKAQIEALAQVEASLDKSETTLGKLLVTLPTLSDTAELKTTAQGLLDLIAELRGKLSTNGATETELTAKVNELTAEKVALEGENAELKEQIMALEAEKVGLAAQNTTLRKRVAELEALLAAQPTEGTCETARTTTETENTATGVVKTTAETVGTATAASISAVNNDAETQGTSNETETESDNAEDTGIYADKISVNIPNLGDEPTLNFWWLLVPVGGVLIMCALWLKRMFGRGK